MGPRKMSIRPLSEGPARNTLVRQASGGGTLWRRIETK
jgi:hypothetical protein